VTTTGVLRGSFIAPNIYIVREKRSQIKDLCSHLNEPEKEAIQIYIKPKNRNNN
jgi:hypothetical protein